MLTWEEFWEQRKGSLEKALKNPDWGTNRWTSPDGGDQSRVRDVFLTVGGNSAETSRRSSLDVEAAAQQPWSAHRNIPDEMWRHVKETLWTRTAERLKGRRVLLFSPNSQSSIWKIISLIKAFSSVSEFCINESKSTFLPINCNYLNPSSMKSQTGNKVLWYKYFL